MTDSDGRFADLPWVRRDHERIEALLSEIHSTLQRGAMSFVVHRLLEDLGVLCRVHFARQHRALESAGMEAQACADGRAFLQRLAAFQRQIRVSRHVDHAALWDFLDDWRKRHQDCCENGLRTALNRLSHGTRWDLRHNHAAHLTSGVWGIPLDPEASGAFLV